MIILVLKSYIPFLKSGGMNGSIVLRDTNPSKLFKKVLKNQPSDQQWTDYSFMPDTSSIVGNADKNQESMVSLKEVVEYQWKRATDLQDNDDATDDVPQIFKDGISPNDVE